MHPEKLKKEISPRTKVLVITPHYTPDFGPSAPIFTSLSEDLREMGCEITVITGFPHYPGAKQVQGPRRFFQEQKHNGVRIIRIFVYAVPKDALWRRLLYHGAFNILAALATLRVGKPDILLANAPSLWSGMPLIVKTIVRRIPFIYMVFDIFPDVLVTSGVFKHQTLINFMDKIERYFYARSSFTSVLSHGFKENLMQKRVPADKISVIPPGVDTDFIRPLARDNELRERWNLNGKFIVLYAGNMGFSQGLDNVLEAAELLQDHSDIAFVFVGDGATKQALQSIAEEKSLNNVSFFPFQPREDVPLVYALADVSLVCLKSNIVVESVPSKTYSIMASARPVLATVAQNTEVGHLLNQAQCGACIEPGNANVLAEKIISLYKNKSIRTDMGMRGRQFVVEHFGRKATATQYYRLIEQITNAERKIQ